MVLIPYKRRLLLLIVIICISSAIIVGLLCFHPKFKRGSEFIPSYFVSTVKIKSQMSSKPSVQFLTNDSVLWPVNEPNLWHNNNNLIVDADLKQWLKPNCKTRSSKESRKHWKLRKLMSDASVQQRFSNCDDYFRKVPVEAMRIREHEETLTKKTRYSFGFAHLVHNEVGILEIFMAVMFRPHNVHCIHVDRKADQIVYKSIESLIRCYTSRFGEGTMFSIRRPIAVYWGHVSGLALHAGASYWKMDKTLKNSLSSRQIMLVIFTSAAGTELPMGPYISTYEMMEQVQGGNIVESFPHPNIDRVNRYYTLIRNGSGMYEFDFGDTKFERSPIAPFNLTLFKGLKNVVITRNFSLFLLNHPVAIGFYNWLEETLMPEETFYATLARIKHIRPGNIAVQDIKMPLGNNSYPVRYTIWENENQPCYGKFVRTICILALEDLAFIQTQRGLVANKFSITFDALAPVCQWKYLRDLADKTRRK